jgi:hypothetical protein
LVISLLTYEIMKAGFERWHLVCGSLLFSHHGQVVCLPLD